MMMIAMERALDGIMKPNARLVTEITTYLPPLPIQRMMNFNECDSPGKIDIYTLVPQRNSQFQSKVHIILSISCRIIKIVEITLNRCCRPSAELQLTDLIGKGIERFSYLFRAH